MRSVTLRDVWVEVEVEAACTPAAFVGEAGVALEVRPSAHSCPWPPGRG